MLDETLVMHWPALTLVVTITLAGLLPAWAPAVYLLCGGALAVTAVAFACVSDWWADRHR